jgi:hypothetical protein
MFVKLSRYFPGNPFLQGPSSISNTKSTNIAIIIGLVLGGILALVSSFFLLFVSNVNPIPKDLPKQRKGH